MFWLQHSTSTNTGVAPAISIAFAAAIKLWLTVITSSPEPIPNALSVKNNPEVQLVTATQLEFLNLSHNFFQIVRTSDPVSAILKREQPQLNLFPLARGRALSKVIFDPFLGFSKARFLFISIPHQCLVQTLCLVVCVKSFSKKYNN
jgi:hypothetical protein